MGNESIGTTAYDRDVAKGIEIKTTDLYNLGILLESQRGIDKVIELYDFNEYRERFGNYDRSYYGNYVVNSFYNQISNAPVKIFAKRFISSTAAAAKVTLKDIATVPENTLKLEAGWKNYLDKGTWGNKIGYEITHTNKASTQVSVASTALDEFIFVDSIAGFEVGDAINIDDTVPIYRKITSIDETEKKINFTGAIGAIVPLDTDVLTLNFDLSVWFRDDKGVLALAETIWTGLSMQPEVSGYVEKVINNQYVGSKYLYATDLDSVSALEETLPAETTKIEFLSSGSNGTAPVDLDWYNELSNFNDAPVRMLINAESQSAKVNEDGMIYCKGKGNVVWLSTGSINMTFDEAKIWGANYMGSELKYGIGYMQWVGVDDPIGQGSNPLMEIPVIGAVCGYWMQEISDRGFHKNPAGQVRNLKGIRYIVQNDDTEQDTNNAKKVTELGDLGVNVLQWKRGKGFLIKDARAFSSDKRYKWATNIFMLAVIKETLKISIEQSEMEPLGFPWLTEVSVAADTYMRGLYRGSTNNGTQSAFFQGFRDDGSPFTYADVIQIIANASNNTNSDLQNGIANIYVNFAPPSPAEIILIGVGIPIIKKEG